MSPPQLRRGHLAVWNLEARAPGQAPQAGNWERFLTGASPAPPSGPHSRACARRVRPRRGPFGIETPPGEVNSPFGKFLRLRRWNLRRRRRCPRGARALGKPGRSENGEISLQTLLQLRLLGLVPGLAPAGAGPGGDPSGLNSLRAK